MPARTTTFGDASRMFRRLAGLGPWRTGGSGGAASFHGLAPALTRLEAGRPDVARQLYGGRFALAGQLVECRPAEVFSVEPPDDAWREALHGFTWLADLAAPDLALYQVFARSLVQGWWRRPQRASFASSCTRLIAWSQHGGFLLSGASSEFHRQFFQAAAAEARRLANFRPREAGEQLRQSIALLTAGLAFRPAGDLRDGALRRAAALIDAVILPDGGHAERSPRSLLGLLADLVPLRDAMEVQRIAIPRQLNAAMERALPMLRMLCHGDDGLAVFHGVEQTSPGLVRALFARDRSFGRPLSQAPQSGYCRMAQGSSLVIVDCGAPVVCDSALAFEFSDGAQRIVGSCGVPLNASPAWQAAARQAAAHSTVEIDDLEVRRVQSLFARRSRRKPAVPITAELLASPAGTLTKVRSLAHAAAWGLEHRRELFLAADGHDFRGEDCFVRCDAISRDWPEAAFAVRFHLHPSVKASADRRGSSVLLLMPNKDAWQFSARGGTLGLEESIYLASGPGPRGCLQIVIRGVTGRPERINWAFRKLDRKAKSTADPELPPRLPF